MQLKIFVEFKGWKLTALKKLYMNLLNKFFPQKEEKEKVLNEKPYFKDQHIRYYTKTLASGTTECWAYPVAHKMGTDLFVDRGEPIFLGKIVKEEVTKTADFFELPMPIQRGALRLFCEIGVYQDIEKGDF